MKLILACTPSGGIGYKNKLPWTKLCGDLKRFKKLTARKAVVMGHNTWKSLPKKPLPNRLNLIISSSPHKKSTSKNFLFLKLDHLLKLSHKELDTLWLIGGASLVNSCWSHVSEIHLSKTHDEFTCDTFIDLNYIKDNYEKVSSEHFIDHEYQIWRKK